MSFLSKQAFLDSLELHGWAGEQRSVPNVGKVDTALVAEGQSVRGPTL